MSPNWYVVIVVVALALIGLDVVLRKKGLAKDISGERKSAYKVRFAVLGIVTVVLLIAAAVRG